jgi:hypothetical protein
MLRIILILIFWAIPLCAQWPPINANSQYPRAMLLPADTTLLNQYMQQEIPLFLMNSMIAAARQAIPPGNSTSAERRQRATLAKNAAFCAWQANIETKDKNELAQKAKKILDEINTDIPQLSITMPNGYEDWQWHSKELIDLLTAYDIMNYIMPDSMQQAQNKLIQFADNLHVQATKKIVGLSFFGTVKNNHTLMTAAAIGMAAVEIPQAMKSEQWLKDALAAIDDVFWKSGQSNGEYMAGYAEGPYYLRYAMLNILPFFRAYKNYIPDPLYTIAGIKHPWYDKRYDNLYIWIKEILQPDGMLPAIGDTYMNMAFPELALLEKSELNYPFEKEILYQQLVSTVDMRANYLCAMPKTEYIWQPGLKVLPEAGDILFKNGRGSKAWYVHGIAKYGDARTAGAGHSQADASSFLLWTQGHPMALDPGYIQYSQRDLINNAQNHSMILIDGKGPDAGQPLRPGSADAKAGDYFSIPGLEYCQINTNYLGAQISRSLIVAGGSIFCCADNITAQQKHIYTWQMHGNGYIGGDTIQGLAMIDTAIGSGYWKKGNAELYLIANAQDKNKCSADTALHEESYGKTGIHTAFRLHSQLVQNTGFAAMMAPGSTKNVKVLSLTDASAGTAAIEYQDNASFICTVKDSGQVQRITAFTEKDHGYDIITDAALFGIWQGSGYNEYALLMKNGRIMKDYFSNYEILKSDKNITCAISIMENGFAGYINQKCILHHRLLDLIPYSLQDSLYIHDIKGNIISWSQDSIYFAGPGTFIIQTKSGRAMGINTIDSAPEAEYHAKVKNGQIYTDLYPAFPLQSTIYNSKGMIVYRSILQQNGIIDIPVNQLHKGLYFIRTEDGKMMQLLHLSDD